MMMAPVFPGAPWVPKFERLDWDLKYNNWKEWLQVLVQYAGQTEQQKVGVVMGALPREAKRHTSVSIEDKCSTADEIFNAIDRFIKSWSQTQGAL